MCFYVHVIFICNNIEKYIDLMKKIIVNQLKKLFVVKTYYVPIKIKPILLLSKIVKYKLTINHQKNLFNQKQWIVYTQ